MKILMSGYNGKMGKTIREIYENVENINDFVENSNEISTEYVIIDFSNPSTLEKLLTFSIENNLSLVLCTTGYTEEQIEMIENAAKKVPILASYNTSIGINLIADILQKTPALKEFDCEIIDIHHKEKKDAPSGTGILLRNSIGIVNSKGIDIPIHSLRIGNVVGEHKVIFSKDDETIEIIHKAGSRKIFANGAIAAAKFLIGKKPRLYGMEALLKEKNK